MCLNRYEIFNKYTGQNLFVDCGHCPECLVSKSERSLTRLIHDFEPNFKYYFVTLTYNNRFVPYVLHQNIYHDDSSICVYRGDSELVTSVHFDSKEQYFEVKKTMHLVPFLRNHFVFGAVGVIVWNDVVKFLKRLRKNGYSFKYFAVGEYGETFYRPHFHILFKTKHDEKTFYNAVTSCWSFCDWVKVERAFEVAISPEKYLSLYLASGSNLPPFYKISHFRQKKSHSLFYGSSDFHFSLVNVFRSAEKHDLTYYKDETRKSSSSTGSFIPYPTYVINRYFPKFKGFSKLLRNDFIFFAKSVSEHDKRYAIYETFAPIDEKERLSPHILACSQGLRYYSILKRLRLSPCDVRDIIRKVNRCYEFSKILDVDFDYYLNVWYNVYITLFSQTLKNSLLSTSSFNNYYFNINDFVMNKVRSPTLNESFEMLSSLDSISPISSYDVEKHISSIRKLSKYNKNKKIKIHLL